MGASTAAGSGIAPLEPLTLSLSFIRIHAKYPTTATPLSTRKQRAHKAVRSRFRFTATLLSQPDLSIRRELSILLPFERLVEFSTTPSRSHCTALIDQASSINAREGLAIKPRGLENQTLVTEVTPPPTPKRQKSHLSGNPVRRRRCSSAPTSGTANASISRVQGASRFPSLHSI